MTIIVLLILAGISISMLTGQNGILTKADNAKEQMEIGTEKEQVNLAYADARGQSLGEKITKEQLQNGLDSLVGENETKTTSDNGSFIVEFEESGRYYKIDDWGNVIGPIEIIEDTTPGILTGDGTQENPFVIMSIEDLVVFSNMVNGTGIKLNENRNSEEIIEANSFDDKYVVLGQTLDFNSKLSYVDYTRKDFGDINNNGIVEELLQELTNGEGFNPIGDYGQNTKKFCGTFNGKDYSILNLYINRKNNDYQGLFGYVEGNITNIKVSGNIKGRNNCGGITGYLSNGKIQSSSNSVNIEAYGNAGGISGYTSGANEISDCYNIGNIVTSGGNDVGGISGTNYNGGIIRRCINEGNIIGYGEKTGGILGSNWNRIDSCINIGKIEGNGVKIGGITGYQWNAIIKNTYNLGDIVNNSSGETGGITGWNGSSNVFNCFSVGNVSNASGKIGAVVAFNSGTVSNSYYFKDEKINSKIYGINGSDPSGQAEKYGNKISDFYTNAFIIEKLKWTAYETKEDIINDEYKCWIVTEGSRPRLYWEVDTIIKTTEKISKK